MLNAKNATTDTETETSETSAENNKKSMALCILVFDYGQ